MAPPYLVAPSQQDLRHSCARSWSSKQYERARAGKSRRYRLTLKSCSSPVCGVLLVWRRPHHKTCATPSIERGLAIPLNVRSSANRAHIALRSDHRARVSAAPPARPLTPRAGYLCGPALHLHVRPRGPSNVSRLLASVRSERLPPKPFTKQRRFVAPI